MSACFGVAELRERRRRKRRWAVGMILPVDIFSCFGVRFGGVEVLKVV